MYQIGTIDGIPIYAGVDNGTDANVLSAIIETAMDMRWRPASEYPGSDTDVLVISPAWSGVEIGQWQRDEGQWRIYGKIEDVTHWMPLPKKMPSAEEAKAIIGSE